MQQRQLEIDRRSTRVAELSAAVDALPPMFDVHTTSVDQQSSDKSGEGADPDQTGRQSFIGCVLYWLEVVDLRKEASGSVNFSRHCICEKEKKKTDSVKCFHFADSPSKI